MTNSKRPFLPVFALLCLLFIQFNAFPIQPHFYLSQSLDQDWNYGLSCTAVTGYIDSRISLKKGELYSWSLASEPVPGVRILAGSMAFSGLPARARNPVFPVSSSFYKPIGVVTGKVLNYGTTKKVDQIGVDCALGLWRVVSFVSPAGLTDGPAWLQVSRVLVFEGEKPTLVRFSVFGDAHRQEPPKDTSWFRRDEYLPATKVVTPGFELVASRGGLSASFIGFSAFSRLRKPAGAFAADAAFASKFFSLSGGIYSADYAFTELDGDESDVLRRIFLSPTLHIPFDADTGTEFSLGGIIHVDTRRNDSMKENVPVLISGGAEVRFQSRSFYGNFKAQRTDEGADFSTSANFRRFIADWLQWQLKGQTSALLDTRETPGLKDSEVSSRITIRAGKIFNAGFGISATFPTIGNAPVFAGDLATALSLKGSKTLWKLTFAAAKTADATPVTMRISLATTVK